MDRDTAMAAINRRIRTLDAWERGAGGGCAPDEWPLIMRQVDALADVEPDIAQLSAALADWLAKR